MKTLGVVLLLLLAGCWGKGRKWNAEDGCWEEHHCLKECPSGDDMMTWGVDEDGNCYLFTDTCVCRGLDTDVGPCIDDTGMGEWCEDR